MCCLSCDCGGVLTHEGQGQKITQAGQQRCVEAYTMATVQYCVICLQLTELQLGSLQLRSIMLPAAGNAVVLR